MLLVNELSPGNRLPFERLVPRSGFVEFRFAAAISANGLYESGQSKRLFLHDKRPSERGVGDEAGRRRQLLEMPEGALMSGEQKHVSFTCWECDATGLRTTVVSVPIRDECTLSVALCDDCVRTYWPPLVEDGTVDLSSI
jgi:hypothetical protein